MRVIDVGFRRFFIFTIYFLAIAILPLAHAAPPTPTRPQPARPDSWLYRVDTRAPDVIFRTGFTPRGTDGSLVAHFLHTGWGEREIRTRFVSVTDDYDTAVRFASDVLDELNNNDSLPNQVDHVYIYRIRPSIEFYNMRYSMEMALAEYSDRRYAHNGDVLTSLVRDIQGGLEAFGWEREWVWTGSGGIPASQIESVDEAWMSAEPNASHPDLDVNIDHRLSETNRGFAQNQAHVWNETAFVPVVPETSDGTLTYPIGMETSAIASNSGHGQYLDTSMVPPCQEMYRDAANSTCPPPSPIPDDCEVVELDEQAIANACKAIVLKLDPKS